MREGGLGWCKIDGCREANEPTDDGIIHGSSSSSNFVFAPLFFHSSVTFRCIFRRIYGPSCLNYALQKLSSFPSRHTSSFRRLLGFCWGNDATNAATFKRVNSARENWLQYQLCNLRRTLLAWHAFSVPGIDLLGLSPPSVLPPEVNEKLSFNYL